jgi:hypothetical protein
VRRLSDGLRQLGHRTSHETVARLLRGLGYSLQANAKVREGRQHPDHDAQFEHINDTVTKAIDNAQPVISVDTKKKELVGDFKNGGPRMRPTVAMEGRLGTGRLRRLPSAATRDQAASTRHPWGGTEQDGLAKGRNPDQPASRECRQPRRNPVGWPVERTISWLHQFRRLLVRFERRAEMHEAFLVLGCCLICLRKLQGSF